LLGDLANRINRLRRGRSGQWLSDRTHELGYRVSRAVISDLETGRRRYLTTAELLVIAAALDVAPVALLYPGPYDEEIEALPDVTIPKRWAVQWFSGTFSAITDKSDRDEYRQNMEQLRTARTIWDWEDELFEVVIPKEAGPRRDQALVQADLLKRQIEQLKAARDA
jgi:transcriptional regulator with XRE-family HTH domain